MEEGGEYFVQALCCGACVASQGFWWERERRFACFQKESSSIEPVETKQEQKVLPEKSTHNAGSAPISNPNLRWQCRTPSVFCLGGFPSACFSTTPCGCLNLIGLNYVHCGCKRRCIILQLHLTDINKSFGHAKHITMFYGMNLRSVFVQVVLRVRHSPL